MRSYEILSRVGGGGRHLDELFDDVEDFTYVGINTINGVKDL